MRKHSVVIAGHRTSISLETAFWRALLDIAKIRGVSANQLITRIDRERQGNLSSAIRLCVLAAMSSAGWRRGGGADFLAFSTAHSFYARNSGWPEPCQRP